MKTTLLAAATVVPLLLTAPTPAEAAVRHLPTPTLADSAATTLQATVGPGFTITLKKSGKKVTTLKHGTYLVRVADRSSIHNFRLRGPGVNKATSVPRVYSITWKVTLKKGTYRFVCDPHAMSMKGSFRVT